MARKRMRQAAEKVHDRRATDLPINSAVAIAVVTDPYSDCGEKIEVLRSVRDDPLAGMHARQQIDDAQLAAGRHFQRLQEMAEIGSIGAIDPTKEAVDGGRIPEPITDGQVQAIRQLQIASLTLGREGYLLVSEILGHRASIRAAAENRGSFSKAGWEYWGRRFRECLETLAIHWGYVSRALDRPGATHP